MMKASIVESAAKKYNEIMNCIGQEHKTIGTILSENSSDNPVNIQNRLYTLRDMVAECDYILSLYYESGHGRNDLRYGDELERKCWRSDVGKLKRFIAHYEKYLTPEIGNVERHCSRYDVEPFDWKYWKVEV